MSDLAAANRCHAVLERELPKLAKKHPGMEAVLAYIEDDAVAIRFARDYAAAERIMDALPDEQRAGAIVMELLAEDHVFIL